MLICAQINSKLPKNIKDKNSYFESSLKNLQKSTHTEFLDPRTGKKGNMIIRTLRTMRKEAKKIIKKGHNTRF